MTTYTPTAIAAASAASARRAGARAAARRPAITTAGTDSALIDAAAPPREPDPHRVREVWCGVVERAQRQGDREHRQRERRAVGVDRRGHPEHRAARGHQPGGEQRVAARRHPAGAGVDRDREQHTRRDREQARRVERAEPEQVGEPHEREEHRPLAREHVAERLQRRCASPAPTTRRRRRRRRATGWRRTRAAAARPRPRPRGSARRCARARPSPRTRRRRSASRSAVIDRARYAVREVCGGRMVRSPAVGFAADRRTGRMCRVLAKHIFVTGGVASSLGQGAHRLLARAAAQEPGACGSRCRSSTPTSTSTPGTMNPFQHGEVFVTDDGGETDLDLGHYERFVDVPLTRRVERHHRLDLPGGARQGAPRRLPRRDRAGDPAHHQRDQGADPRARRPTTSTS